MGFGDSVVKRQTDFAISTGGSRGLPLTAKSNNKEIKNKSNKCKITYQQKYVKRISLGGKQQDLI